MPLEVTWTGSRSTVTLREKIYARDRGVFLFGTTPPRLGSDEDKVRRVGEALAARLAPLDLDAVNVYDVQDEHDRDVDGARPFPYLPTVDSRLYARLLSQLTGREVIAYKCVVRHPERAFPNWLDETAREFGLANIVLVGGSSSRGSYQGPSLGEAVHQALGHEAGYLIGGVTLAERHVSRGTEHERLIAKSNWGMSFFTSQVVYRPEPTIRLLSDYADLCRRRGPVPSRVILTFAPCGTAKTVTFLRWLGVELPENAAADILGSPVPVQRSIDICRENLARIMESQPAHAVPLGINVESVSIYRDEIDASVELFHVLRSMLEEYYGPAAEVD